MAFEERSVLHFLFASPNTSDRSVFYSIEDWDNVCEGILDIALSSIKELEILLSLLGINDFVIENLPNSEYFSGLIDISQYKIPEFNETDFDQFYELWLSKTGRESNMDEYGQLIFIQGEARKWNQRLCKVILIEKY
ncbi:hypothetical protein HRE53_04785 [Acaryochloris sp. 'Moss Beach']|uniref:hypothetical protein n=1 Tax=Acaryochloris sp. 'Moss Beach' TaxID=2740837 RepID=UPI001F23E4B1|nr:hypothetical protein [Acaryochloris sp. 'Moss Beach']UJB70427.1 hypothetical protein HRE53_04785 [Acaryochloris sp. 'Moss Beach']